MRSGPALIDPKRENCQAVATGTRRAADGSDGGLRLTPEA